MNINKHYLIQKHSKDLEQIKSNLIKINYQMSRKDNTFFDGLKDDLYYMSFQIYINKNEYYIIEIEEELKQNKSVRIIDVVDDIDIMKKLNNENDRHK